MPAISELITCVLINYEASLPFFDLHIDHRCDVSTFFLVTISLKPLFLISDQIFFLSTIYSLYLSLRSPSNKILGWMNFCFLCLLWINVYSVKTRTICTHMNCSFTIVIEPNANKTKKSPTFTSPSRVKTHTHTLTTNHSLIAIKGPTNCKWQTSGERSGVVYHVCQPWKQEGLIDILACVSPVITASWDSSSQVSRPCVRACVWLLVVTWSCCCPDVDKGGLVVGPGS